MLSAVTGTKGDDEDDDDEEEDDDSSSESSKYENDAAKTALAACCMCVTKIIHGIYGHAERPAPGAGFGKSHVDRKTKH
jgi:hypothetical protein